MVISLVNEFILHLLIGAGICFGFVVLFARMNRRRPVFRFGGDDVVSIGTGRNWMVWYLVGFSFEFITSFLTHRLYTEIALSAFQALAFSIGIFIVDRVSMVFEPESYWRPGLGTTALDIKPTVSATVTPVAVNTQPVAQVTQQISELPPPPPQTPEDTWLGKRVRTVVRNVVSVPDAVVQGHRDAQDQAKAEDEKRRQSAKDNLKKNLEGY